MFDLLLFEFNIVTVNYDKIRFCNLLCSLRFKHGRHLSLIFDWKIYTFFFVICVEDFNLWSLYLLHYFIMFF